MKHIKLFESSQEIDNPTQRELEFNPQKNKIFCITGPEGSLVGILSPKSEESLDRFVEKDPDKLRVQTFSFKGDEYLEGFMVQTREGDWKFIKGQGGIYKSNDSQSKVFPILKKGMFISFRRAPQFPMYLAIEQSIGYAISSLLKGIYQL